MSKIYFIGDVHIRSKQPYLNSKKEFWNWFLSLEDVNAPDNYLILLGDLADKPKLSGELNFFINNLFLERLKFKTIYLLTGNHDSRRLEGNYLDSLKAFSNVIVLDEPQEFEIEELSILALPHYIVKHSYQVPMKQYYSSLIENQDFENNNDIVIAHFFDETQVRGIDLTGIKGRRVFGDVHIASQNYLGTPVINRADEAGKDSRIASIDVQTKDFKYLPVPKLLDFYKVDYENPPKAENLEDIPFKLYIMENAPSKKAAEELSKKLKGWLHSYSTVSEEKIVNSEDLKNFSSDRDKFIKEAVSEFALTYSNISKGALEKLKTVLQIEEKKCQPTTSNVKKPARLSNVSLV